MRNATPLFSTLAALLLFTTPAAAQMAVTGFLTGGSNSAVSVLVGERGFSLTMPLSLNDDFPAFGNCNGDPAHCTPGTTLPVSVLVPDATIAATLDGSTYRSGCPDCTASAFYQTSGSITLPPMAATATATSRFSINGTFSAPGQPQVSFTGAGTVTLFLHSRASQGFPNSWSIDSAELRLDSALPSPWLSLDVGTVGTPGSTSASTSADGTTALNVAGAGADIWGTSDAFRFAFAYPAGNEIVARIDGEQNTSPFAKAGVMIRNSFSADAANALLDVKPDGGVEFLARSSNGAATTFVAGANATLPVWLKLSEGQQQITASISADGQSWQVVGSVPTTFGAVFIGVAVTSHDPSALNDGIFSEVSVPESATEPLPTGWLQTDVGAVSMAGSATANGAEIDVTGDGSDIWGTADAFHYVYQQFGNDGSIVARVTSLQNTSPYAKAGVMMRAGTAANAAHALVDVKPDGGVEFLVRDTDGGETTFVAGGFQAMPTWLKLSKSGLAFTASVSMDGTSWTPIGSASLSAFGFGTAGLAVTSHDPGALTTGTFDSIALDQSQAIPLPWQAANVGTTGLTGSASYQSGTFTVEGAGADIWDTADSFMFVYQTKNTDPSTLSARVVSETNTNAYAKAGLMLRGSPTDPGSAFVMIDMKPNGELEVLQRPSDGGLVSYLGGAAAGFGTYLRLQRTGSTVIVSYSADGAAWTTLATTTVSMPTTATIGMAVTSHDTSQLDTAVFDTVTGP